MLTKRVIACLDVTDGRVVKGVRFAKLQDESALMDADRIFRYWSHVQLMLHAETYFHHHELGLMPEGHWRGYERFMTSYVRSSGFAEAWADIGSAFSDNFARWVDALLARNAIP